MKKRVAKKLELHRETLVNLSRVTGGRQAAGGGEVDSAGIEIICYFSDCNPCETTVYADDLQPIKADPAPKDGFVAKAAV